MTVAAPTLPPIILGSSSPFRKQLLSKLNLTFSQVSPEIDERALDNEAPIKMVQRLAKEKALEIAKANSNHIIITSDQCAVFNDKTIGKPHTTENAIKQLSMFSNHAVTFYTALCVHNTRTGHQYEYIDSTIVHFRELSIKTIQNYLEIEQPLRCAGSFKSEGLGVTLFNKIESRDPNALIGLPLMALTDIFYEMGYPLPLKPQN